MLDILNHFYLLAFFLGDPANALANPAGIKGPVTSNIFEAKRDSV
jgi:S1-C subfamily serine protease